MNDLDEIKRKKIIELQRRQQEAMENESDEQAQVQQQIEQLENIVKQVLTKDALSRYSTLKIAHPEKAVQLLLVLAQAIQQRKISKIDDQQLKEILIKLEPKRKETKINRV